MTELNKKALERATIIAWETNHHTHERPLVVGPPPLLFVEGVKNAITAYLDEVDEPPSHAGWRHKKRGTTYDATHDYELQTSRPLVEGDVVRGYICRETGKPWARPVDEFQDGRFERIPAAPEPPVSDVLRETLERVNEALNDNRIGYAMALIDDALKSAPSHSPSPAGWQDIATAPKDGTMIIVYRPTADNKYIRKVGPDYWGMFGSRGSWGRSNAAHQPTHWQPLPAAPKGRESE